MNFGRKPLAVELSGRRFLPKNNIPFHRVNKLPSLAMNRVSGSLKLRENKVLQVRALRITNGQPVLGKYWGEELARLGWCLTGTK